MKMTAAVLLLALGTFSEPQQAAPCAGMPVVAASLESVGLFVQSAAVVYRMDWRARGSRPWVLFAPAGSTSAKAYWKNGGAWHSTAFENEFPGEGHVFYRGPPALPVRGDWMIRQPFYVAAWGSPVGCVRAAPLASILRSEPSNVPLLLYFGVLGGIALFMLVLFASSREAFIGWYFAYLCSLLAYQLFRADYLWMLAWPFAPWHEGDVELALWGPNVALYAAFARSFLQTSRYARTIDRLLLALIVGFLAYLPIVEVVQRAFGARLDPGELVPVVMMVAVFALVITATIGRVRQGYRPAIYFLLSYPILFTFVCFALWQFLTHADATIGLYGAEIGTGSECLFLAFAIGDRLHMERRLRAVVASLPEIIVRTGRDGRIRFVTPNVGEFFGQPQNRLIGRRAAELVRPAALRQLARAAVRASGQGAAAHIEDDRGAAGRRRLDAIVHTERDAGGRIAEIQVILREPSRAAEPVRRGTSLRVCVFRACAETARGAVRLTGREIELLCALALQSAPVPGSVLASMLWPDQDARTATGTLQTTLSRLRRKLPPGTIEARPGGYSLDPKTGCDAAEVRTALREGDLAALARLYPEISLPLPATLTRREWFGPIAAGLESRRVEAMAMLARSSLARGDAAGALAIAADLRRLDLSDELGYSLAIQAYQMNGDELGALRMYYDCTRNLREDLGTLPSPELRKLVHGADAERKL